MSSLLQTPRFTSLSVSVCAHSAMLGLLFFLSEPIWTTSPARREITRLAAPPRPVLLKLSPKKLARLLPDPAPTARTLQLPAPTPAAPALRIEVPLDIPQLAPAPLPLLAAPPIVAQPLVKVGMLDRPAAPSSAAPQSTAPAGFDSPNPGEGRTSTRRIITGAGFEGASSGQPLPRRTLANGGFDQTEPAPTVMARSAAVGFEGIEILEKPRPLYSDEARRLRIEGTVQLRVVFGAAGRIQVLSIVKGLGHGLDEAAIQAAQAIRFRPARRDGQPVDAPALIQIQFQLA